MERDYPKENPKGVDLNREMENRGTGQLGPPRWGYRIGTGPVPRVARRSLHSRRSTLGWLRTVPLALKHQSFAPKTGTKLGTRQIGPMTVN